MIFLPVKLFRYCSLHTRNYYNTIPPNNKEKKKTRTNSGLPENRILFELSLASSLRLLLTLYARLLVVLSLTNLLLNACLSAISLKPTKGAVQRFILFYDYT